MAKKRQKKGNAPSKLGFSLGVFLIVLAFVLMGIRTFLLDATEGIFQPSASVEQAWNKSLAEKTLSNIQEDRAEEAARQNRLPAIAVEVPTREHNPRIGRINAPTEVIVFGHLGCLECRKALRVAFNHAQENPMSTRVVSKFAMPQNKFSGSTDEKGVEAGLFAAIAQDERLFWEAFAHMGKTGNTLHDRDQLLVALEAVGIPLKAVRTKLAEKSALYMRQIESDLADYQSLQTPDIPVVVVNGRLMNPTHRQSVHEDLADWLTRQ